MPNTKQPLTKQPAHSESCDAGNTGRYSAGCKGCLAEANEARQRLEDLDRRQAADRARARKSKRAMAIERANELIAHLEEHASEAAGEGNALWHADLSLFLSALYASDLPTKDGYLRIELDLVDAIAPRRDGFFATRRTA